MDTDFIIPLVQWMQTLSSEIVSLLTLGVCVIGILALLRFFGVAGLYLYGVIVIIAANIQVLKVATFAFIPEPVALGTLVFATAYLVSDILTEHYGEEVARLGVWLSVVAQILMSVIMILSLGYKAAPEDTVHQAMNTLFAPSIRLLAASLIAFAISQLTDIWLFQRINEWSKGKWLWLRTSLSTTISGLLDNIIFSVLAWVVLSPTPIGLSTLIFTYILGTYLARLLVSVISTPVLYLSYFCLPKKQSSVRLA